MQLILHCRRVSSSKSALYAVNVIKVKKEIMNIIKNYLTCWNIIPVYNPKKIDDLLSKISGNINMLICFHKYINKNYVINLGYTDNFKWLILNLTGKLEHCKLYAAVPAKWNNDYTIKRLVKEGSAFDLSRFLSSSIGFNTIRNIVSELDASKEHIAPEIIDENYNSPNEMVLCAQDYDEKIQYQYNWISAVELKWIKKHINSDVNSVIERIPSEKTKEYPCDDFIAAGVNYHNLEHLCINGKNDMHDLCCFDILGRTVIRISEHFPCFDDYDDMYENRYNYWFLIINGNKLTRVTYSDGCSKVKVTDDVKYLEKNCWEAIEGMDFCINKETGSEINE